MLESKPSIVAARALGQYPQARTHFEALADVARQLGPDSTWAGWAYNSLGSVLVETGDTDVWAIADLDVLARIYRRIAEAALKG